MQHAVLRTVVDSGCARVSQGHIAPTRMWALAMAATLITVSVALAAPPAKNSSAGGAHAYFKMEQVQVIDQAGLGKPTPAADLMIPTDWKFQSDVHWANRGCFTDLAAISFRAQSPDGRLVIEAFPSFSWQYVSDPAVQRYLTEENQQGAQFGLKPCPVVPPVPAADVLRKRVLPEFRAGSRSRAWSRCPIWSSSCSNGCAIWTTGRAYGTRGAIPCRLGACPPEVRSGWPAGRGMGDRGERGPGRSIATGSGTTQGIDCRAIMLFAMRAPQGQLEANEKLFQMISASLHRSRSGSANIWMWSPN